MSCEFGNNLKKYREILGISQVQIAKELKLNKSTVCKWEKGTIEPDFDNLRKLAKLLNITIDELLDYNFVSKYQETISSNNNFKGNNNKINIKDSFNNKNFL